ncbi:MAG: T9SS type A sorting domain-containing protein [Bacteroidales bacterium]|nr:T9SS type A sorting domain-containing protein [Bacteroidales bacterium]
MKKIFSLILMIGFSIMSYSQCNTGCITGNLSITVGQTSTFTSPIAQCTSCYDWDINGNAISSDNQTVGTVKIVGTDMAQTVQIQGVAVGAFSLQLTYFDETGCHTCCFNGNVVGSPCDINQNGIYQLNVLGDEYIKFYTMPSIQSGGVNNFNYLWTFTYQDGSTSTSNVREPYIPINCSNPVVYTTVVITSTICSKTITKNWIPGVCGTLNYSNKIKSTKTIKVSPNPTSSLIKFDGENLSNYKVSIFNSNGIEIIKNSKIDEGISIEKQEKGIYIYILTDENGYKQEGKIIKE